ncbi:MAG: type II secretion system protein M [Pseudomonadota bacterium]
MNKLTAWYQQLSDRDRKILLASVVSAIVLLFYFLFWNPIMGKAQRTERVLAKEKKNLHWMKENVPQLIRLKGSQSSSADLSKLANQAAIKNDLAISQYQPKGSKAAQIVFEKVSFNKLLSWMHTMEYQNRLILSKVNITKTKENNVVDARINIAKGL